MSVSSVVEIYTGRGGATGEKDADVRQFRVITSDAHDNKYVILNSGMVPQRGNAHNTQANLSCKNVDCQPDPEARSPRHWIVRAEYDNQPFGQLPQLASAQNPNPLLRGVEIEGRTLIGRKARTHGLIINTVSINAWNNGNGRTIPTTKSPLVTTANEPFVGLEEDDIRWVAIVTWNASTIPFWVQDYQGCLNNGDVVITGYPSPMPRWSLRLLNFTHSKRLVERLPSGVDVPYYQSRFELHYKKDLWVTPILNAGFDKLVAGERAEILKTDGSYPAKPMQLDINGAQLATPTDSTTLYRWVADGPDKDFSVFKLSV